MKKFKKITKPLALDFYSIEQMGGEKYVHVFGYCYFEDEWCAMEYCGHITPIKEFIKQITAKHNFADTKAQGLPQYFNAFSQEEMTNYINTYFGGKCADYVLPFSKITEDTPIGNYVF